MGIILFFGNANVTWGKVSPVSSLYAPKQKNLDTMCVCVCVRACMCTVHACVCSVRMSIFLYSGAALVLSIIGVRLLRGSFTELSRQHIIFIFTLLFFNFDYEHYSESLPLDYFVISLVFYKVGGAGGYCSVWIYCHFFLVL